jgi:hypothetical protein
MAGSRHTSHGRRQQGESPKSSDDFLSFRRDPWRGRELADAHGRQARASRIQGETVTSPATGATGAPVLPEYAPVPAIAKGAALNEHGYHVWQVNRNLYAVTDNVYMSAFLATPDGVVIFDAPPNIGRNIRRAVDEITAANGLTNQVTHLIYSHHHADHQGASALFGGGHRPDRPRGDPAAAAARR